MVDSLRYLQVIVPERSSRGAQTERVLMSFSYIGSSAIAVTTASIVYREARHARVKPVIGAPNTSETCRTRSTSAEQGAEMMSRPMFHIGTDAYTFADIDSHRETCKSNGDCTIV